MTSNGNQKVKALQFLDANVYCYVINETLVIDDVSTNL